MRHDFSLKFHLFIKAYLTMGLFLVIHSAVYCQKQYLVDSLESVYNNQLYNEQDKLKILAELATEVEDPQKILSYSLELIEEAQRKGSNSYLYTGYLQQGHALRLKSDLTQALKSYFRAAKIAKTENQHREIGLVNVAIADVYSIMDNHDKAVQYYHSGIEILREENDSTGFASALENLGDEYLTVNKPDSALIIFKESGKIFRALKYELGIAYNLGNIGIAYALQGKNDLAKANMNQAISILEKLEDYYPISVYLTYISDIYVEQNDWQTALEYAQRSLDLAQNYGLKEQMSDANLQLSELYEQTGNLKEASIYYKTHISYKDSVNNIASVQQMADIRTDFEISQKQGEVDLLNEQKRTQQIIVIAIVIALVLLSLLALGLYNRYKFIKKTKNIIESEKQRSDNLLLNILPEGTADELKESGKVKAKRFESVTVLFTDFKEFTNYAEHLTPEELVATVDFYFSKFDEIMEKYGLEKIKTVGDAYMCAGGLPIPTKDHSHKMLQAAFDIIEFVNDVKKDEALIQ